MVQNPTAILGWRFIPILTRRWAAGRENGRLLLLGLESGLVGIGRTNHQLEGAAVTQSNGCQRSDDARASRPGMPAVLLEYQGEVLSNEL